MECLLLLGLSSLLILSTTQDSTNSSYPPSPSYLLLAPNVLRPGVPHSVAVTILVSSPVTVSASISHGNQTVSTKDTIKGGTTKVLTLLPVYDGESKSQYPYILEVKGHLGNYQVFSNSTELQFNPKGHSTFIQTDKLNYFPGQVVKIRAVSIHPDGKPYISPVDIIITDPKGNLLRQWLAAEGILGVVAREFELSENPPLGEWTIVAAVSCVSTEKHFSVAHYVLPKFDVVINTPDVIYREDTLSGFVSAKYSYGKFVQGHMTITFQHYVYGMTTVYEEDREIDGTEMFTFDVTDYYRVTKTVYNEYMDKEFVTIMVNVTEHLTGLTYNRNINVTLAKHRYKLSFDDYPKVLLPSRTSTVTLKISSYNNQPLTVEDQQKTVQVSVMQQILWSWRMDIVDEVALNMSNPTSGDLQPEEIPPQAMMFTVPADGVLSFSIRVMKETETLTIDASLEDSQNTLQLHRRHTYPFDFYLQIQKPSEPAKVGSPLLLHIETNIPKPVVHYIVKSRGQVVSAGRGSVILRMTPEISWAPVASIIAYFVNISGEIISDVLHLPVPQPLQNQVSLSWSSSTLKPAEKVTLRIEAAEPGSLVGILVVDKTTQWMGQSNDITKERILEELKDLSISTDDVYSDMLTMGDPYSMFKSCHLVAMTDANLPKTEHLLGYTFSNGERYPLTDCQQTKPRERLFFPETWIWMAINTSASNEEVISLYVPDSITTWTATAFVMSKNLGLGIIEKPAELTVFQDFFLTLNLPAYIIRGEVLLLEVVLFNYLSEDLQVTVMVGLSDAFEFVFPDSELLFMANTRLVTVSSGRGTSVLFPIKPLLLGEIFISVEAISLTASDFVRKSVLVKAEGLEQSFSTSLLFEVSPPESSISTNITFSFLPHVVKGSKRASVTAVGDVLGPSISGLDSLIQMPFGCGEQNMINFAPNVYVLQYLKSTRKADKDLADRAKTYIMKGYERELSYQRADGSFSAFGDQDPSGSTWLTAFVLKCFLQARPFITIDAQVLHRAAAWLGGQQGLDGMFEEPGRVIHTELQGGLDEPVSLTAYALIALLEDADIRAQYWNQVSSALMFLETRLALGVSSNYSLSLLTYALALSGSANANTALSMLIERADMRDGVPVWSFPDGGLSSSWQPRSADIEMVSYVLLSQHKLGHVAEGLGLMKWLSQQRNHRGGFGSTQDTVVALQALSTFSALRQSDNFNLNIRVNNDSTLVAFFYIHQDNYLLHQSQEIEPEEELHLQVTAQGHGFALFQLNVFYNIKNTELMRRRRDAGDHEAFYLNIELHDEEINSAHLFICSSLSEGLGLTATGMAIMEVGLLSGFCLSPDGVQINDVVKKVETKPGKVILYLDSVTTQEMCLLVPLVMEYKVAKVQEAAVVVYDYYEPRRRTVRMYTSEWRSNVSTCFFCGDDCSDCTGDDNGLFYDVDAASHSRQNLLLTGLLLLMLVILINIFSM